MLTMFNDSQKVEQIIFILLLFILYFDGFERYFDRTVKSAVRGKNFSVYNAVSISEAHYLLMITKQN